jgi:hypothetical protein
MFTDSSKPKMSLGQALRIRWPFLLGITAFHLLVVFVPSLAGNHQLLGALFFAAAVPAALPVLFGAAPYSFWVVASLYWFFGFIATACVKAAIFLAMGWEL